VGFVSRVDDRTTSRCCRGDGLPNVFSPLRETKVGPPSRRSGYLARSAEDLARNEKRNEELFVSANILIALGAVVLVAAIGVASRIGVVLEEVDLAPMTLLVELALGTRNKALQDPLPRHFLGNEVIEVVAFGRGVFGVTADIQVEAGAVFKKDIA